MRAGCQYEIMYEERHRAYMRKNQWHENLGICVCACVKTELLISIFSYDNMNNIVKRNSTPYQNNM